MSFIKFIDYQDIVQIILRFMLNHKTYSKNKVLPEKKSKIEDIASPGSNVHSNKSYYSWRPSRSKDCA